MNKAILVGNLGMDPEFKVLPSGRHRCTFRMATTARIRRENGQSEELTEWHRIAAWGKQAEVCKNYLSKGRKVLVEGRIRNYSYEKDGQKRYSSEVVAHRVEFLGGRKVEPPATGLGAAEQIPF